MSKPNLPPIDTVWPDEYFNRPIETMSYDDLRRLQLKKLKYLLDYAYHNTEFYHRRFREAGVKPSDINDHRDFVKKIPWFTKDDLRRWIIETGDPYGGILGVPEEELAHVCASTGTTGMPTYYAYDRSGALELAEALARGLWAARLRPWMRVGFAPSPFHWYSLMFAEALKTIGVGKFVGSPPVAHPAFAEYLMETLMRRRIDWLFNTPPPASALLNIAKKRGVDLRNSGLLFMTTGGEPVTPGIRKQFLEGFGILDFFDIDAVGEGLYASAECFVHMGSHAWSDKWFVEIVDPDTGEPIEEPTENDRGSIVITNLVNKGSIYIRMNIEDIGWVSYEKCNCGRTHPRIDQLDRLSFLVRIGGRRFTTTDVRNTLEKIPELYTGDFTIVKYAPSMDKLKLRIAPSITPRTPEDWRNLEERVKHAIRSELGVESEVEWVSYDELPIIGWKIRRIIEAGPGA